MAFRFRKTPEKTAEQSKSAGGWYADPYGTAARRWYDECDGWTDKVQGDGEEPDKTGVARVDNDRELGGGGTVLPETTEAGHP